MTARTAGRESPRQLASRWFFPATGAILGVAVVANVRVEQVAPAIFVAVVVGLMVLAHQETLPWRSVVAATALVILLIPIRREALISSLPFGLEPYRVLVTLMIFVWIGALLVDHRVRFLRSVVDGPLLLVLAATAGSLIVNRGRILELGVESTVTKALAFLIGFFLFFWLIVSVIRRFADVDFIVRALVAAGAFIAVASLVEARTGYSVFNDLVRIIPGTGRSAALDPSGLLPVRGGRFRIFGSAQHPIELSAILAMLVPLAVYLVQSTRRWWWGLAFGLLVVGALVSVSRTGVVMLLVVAAVFVWLRPHETIRLWPLMVPGVVVVGVLAPGAMNEVVAGFFPAGGLFAQQENTAAGSGRLESLGPALHDVALRPILGGGYGSRVVVGPETNSFIVDDMWLSLGMEIGVIGVAAWAWLFIRFIRHSSREAKRNQSHRSWFFSAITASVMAFAVGMLLFDAFSFVQVTFLFFIVLALGASQLANVPHAVPRVRSAP